MIRFFQVLVLAGLGLGAGVAVGSVGAAIGLASARQEVKWQYHREIVKNYEVFVIFCSSILLFSQS